MLSGFRVWHAKTRSRSGTRERPPLSTNSSTSWQLLHIWSRGLVSPTFSKSRHSSPHKPSSCITNNTFHVQPLLLHCLTSAFLLKLHTYLLRWPLVTSDPVHHLPTQFPPQPPQNSAYQRISTGGYTLWFANTLLDLFTPTLLANMKGVSVSVGPER